MNKGQITAIVTELMARDFLDYVAVFAPLILAGVMGVVTIYTTMVLPRKRKFTASLYWDDLMNRFVVFIVNEGNAAIMIDRVKLFVRDNHGELKLGERRCLCGLDGTAIIIQPGQAYSFIPMRGSTYDLLGYKGHYFEVDDTNRNLNVYISATDLKGKTCEAMTKFTLGDIDENLQYHDDCSEYAPKTIDIELSVILKDSDSEETITVSELKQWLTKDDEYKKIRKSLSRIVSTVDQRIRFKE